MYKLFMNVTCYVIVFDQHKKSKISNSQKAKNSSYT